MIKKSGLDDLLKNISKKKVKTAKAKDYGSSGLKNREINVKYKGQDNEYTGLKNLGIDDKVYKTVNKPMVQGWQKVHYQNPGQYSNERKQIPKLYRKK